MNSLYFFELIVLWQDVFGKREQLLHQPRSVPCYHNQGKSRVLTAEIGLHVNLDASLWLFCFSLCTIVDGLFSPRWGMAAGVGCYKYSICLYHNSLLQCSSIASSCCYSWKHGLGFNGHWFAHIIFLGLLSTTEFLCNSNNISNLYSSCIVK